jgi:hypothetical protein
VKVGLVALAWNVQWGVNSIAPAWEEFTTEMILTAIQIPVLIPGPVALALVALRQQRRHVAAIFWAWEFLVGQIHAREPAVIPQLAIAHKNINSTAVTLLWAWVCPALEQLAMIIYLERAVLVVVVVVLLLLLVPRESSRDLLLHVAQRRHVAKIRVVT